jgi:thymidylate synthase (FAD)
MHLITKKSLLDHGYIQVIEHWGSDESIVAAARMSTGKGFLGWGGGDCPDMPHDAECRCKGTRKLPDGDEKLLRYLHENKHDTPFEMAGLQIEVQAPIVVFREWHRHRTQSYNEASARYAPLPAIDYVPTLDRLFAGGGHLTKQAGTIAGADTLSEARAIEWQRRLAAHYAATEDLYQWGLQVGVPKELARLPMAVGRYSKMRAQAVLRNWLGFLILRDSSKAQYEIRVYAQAIVEFLTDLFPRTMELFNERKRS